MNNTNWIQQVYMKRCTQNPQDTCSFQGYRKHLQKLTKFDHKATLSMFQIEIILSLFSDHSASKLEIINKKGKYTRKW